MRLGEAPVQWSMPGGSVELLSAMLSVEDMAKVQHARMNLTGGPYKRHGEAPVQWNMPGGSVELLSSMPNLIGGPCCQWSTSLRRPGGGCGAGRGELGGAVGLWSRTVSLSHTSWGTCGEGHRTAGHGLQWQGRGPSPEAWRSCRPGCAASSGPDDYTMHQLVV